MMSGQGPPRALLAGVPCGHHADAKADFFASEGRISQCPLVQVPGEGDR